MLDEPLLATSASTAVHTRASSEAIASFDNKFLTTRVQDRQEEMSHYII